MIIGWLRAMLGPLGVILDFFSAHYEILTVILSLWMLFYAAGHLQVKLIEKRTALLVVDWSQRLLAADPQISLADLHKRILSAWLEEFKNWKYYFVPHKFDFWPVPATSQNVQVKLPLSPEWVAKVLKKNGISLPSATAEASAAALK
jgi:hypothetical protein